MVDTKGLGRPPTLRPDGKDWTTSQFRVENYLESFTSGARSALTWASEQNLAIGNAERDHELHGIVASAENLDEEIYCSLAALLEGEALDILVSTDRGQGLEADRGQGLEAWRRLSHRYDGTGPARLRQNLTHILTPERLTLKTMSVGILQWEEKVRMYEHRTKEALSERVRASVLTSMTAGHGPLKEHLELSAGRLNTYAAIREEITLYLDGKNDSAANSLRSAAAPMDVGGIGEGPAAGGKGPVEGCWTCGGPHYARDCPDADKAAATPANAAHATPPPKGDGKGTKRRQRQIQGHERQERKERRRWCTTTIGQRS
jgi:hypothetical protein